MYLLPYCDLIQSIYYIFTMTKGLVTNDGIDRQKWQRPFTKGK